ncbi:MAG: TRAP transporter large permease [Geminicoccaceae bacterium]|nr:MAG: TRAP transporter large permease [Geminicoccaceae bacterium]
MSPLWLLAIFIFLVAINTPIAISLGLAAVIAYSATFGFDGLLNLAISLYQGARSFPLIAIPLFVFAGAIMNTTGISQRLIAFVSAIVGFVRGGLAMVNIGTSLFFAEISGSAVADVAAIGSILTPAMKKRGYPANFTAAITSSSASLAIIIPPSIPMILYGAMTDTSIVQLFVAGIIPGLLGAFMMFLLAYGFAVRYNFPVEETFQLRRVWQTFKEASWALLVPVIILGGIFGGIFTATEAAGLAVATALFVGTFIYRELNLRSLINAMTDGVIQTAVVMLLVAVSAFLGLYLTQTRVPQQLTVWMLGISQDPILVLAMLNVLFLFVGMFLHGAAAIILVVPIVMPIANAIGVDPVQFGIMVTLNIAIGQQTPPVASVLMTACSIAKADVWDVTKVNVWFIGVLLLLLILVTYVPYISLVLVEAFYR